MGAGRSLLSPHGGHQPKKSSGHLRHLPPQLAPSPPPPEDASHLLLGAPPRWGRQGSLGGCQLPRDSSPHQMGFACPPPAPMEASLGVFHTDSICPLTRVCPCKRLGVSHIGTFACMRMW